MKKFKKFWVLNLILILILLFPAISLSTDQRIQYTDEMVGAGHPTKTDTLNRLTLIEHATDGTHEFESGESLNDDSTNEYVKFSKTSSAVNEITIKNNSTGKWPDISASGETNVSLTLHGVGTGTVLPAIKGYASLNTGIIVYVNDTDVYISGNVIEVDGKIAWWTTQLTYTLQNLSSSSWSFIYLDYSAITTGVAITTSEITDNTTVPSWSDSKVGLYNGSDRCIGFVYADGDTDILAFFWDKNSSFYGWDLLTADVSGSGTGDGTLIHTPFGNMTVVINCLINGPDQNDSDFAFAIKKKGSADTNGLLGIIDTDSDGGTTPRFYSDYTVQTDSNKQITLTIQEDTTNINIYTRGFWVRI